MPPQGYLDMKRKFQAQEGLSETAAKQKAASIWNKQHPNNPVGPRYEQKAMAKALRDKGDNRKPY